MSSKQSRRKRKSNATVPDQGVRLAIWAAAKRAGKTHLRQSDWVSYIQGKKWLAEGLGVTVQSINNWKHVPKDRIMMVHMLTQVPLAKLNPKLFGKQ